VCAIAALPWIGAGFAETKLILVGENLYDHGGTAAVAELVQAARRELARGRRQVTFGLSSYPTLFWHRAGTYAYNWLARRRDPGSYIDDRPEVVAETFNMVAYTNHVKCSPRSSAVSRSTPNGNMWPACGRQILKRELALLDARRILVLGLGSNLASLQRNVLTPPFEHIVQQASRVLFMQDSAGIEVLAVRHPAAYGGAARQLIADVVAAISAA
jgi:hypothetical protein